MELVLRDKDEAVNALVNPTTQEVYDLDTATREQIAEWYLAMLAWLDHAHQAVRLANAVFADRTDKETTLGVNVGRMRVSVPGAEEQFHPDPETLRAALLELAAEGVISREAADEAVAPNGLPCPVCEHFVLTGGYKVSVRALKALRKVSRLDTIIDACGEYRPPARPFQVKKR